MPRYIAIDASSGYIWGDSGDLNGPSQQETPVEFCRRLDESLGETGREYSVVPRHILERTPQAGYTIYRADISGSEVVPIVRDGQDQETIEAVERLCEFEAAVAILPSGWL